MFTSLFRRRITGVGYSRKLLSLIVFAIGVISLPGHGATDTLDPLANKNINEQKTLAQIVETVTNAWNKNEPDTIAGLFLPDAILIMPTGSVVKSRSAIRKRLIDERNGKLKDTTLENRIAGITFPNNQAAIVRGDYQLRGMKILGVETSPAGKFVFHQKKHQGRWMIAKAEILRRN